MRAVHHALLTQAGQPRAPTVLTAKRWGFPAALCGGIEFFLPRPYGSWIMENIFLELVSAKGHGPSAVEAAMQLARTIRQKKPSPERNIQPSDSACRRQPR
jgi:2-methylcitrate dehydratase